MIMMEPAEVALKNNFFEFHKNFFEIAMWNTNRSNVCSLISNIVCDRLTRENTKPLIRRPLWHSGCT